MIDSDSETAMDIPMIRLARPPIRYAALEFDPMCQKPQTELIHFRLLVLLMLAVASNTPFGAVVHILKAGKVAECPARAAFMLSVGIQSPRASLV